MKRVWFSVKLLLRTDAPPPPPPSQQHQASDPAGEPSGPRTTTATAVTTAAKLQDSAAHAAATAEAAATQALLQPVLQLLPPGLALLELRLALPRSLWGVDSHHAPGWLLRDKAAALKLLGAILPLEQRRRRRRRRRGAAAAGRKGVTEAEAEGQKGREGQEGQERDGAVAAAAEEDLEEEVEEEDDVEEEDEEGPLCSVAGLRQAVRDLLEEQPEGGDRDKYRWARGWLVGVASRVCIVYCVLRQGLGHDRVFEEAWCLLPCELAMWALPRTLRTVSRF